MMYVCVCVCVCGVLRSWTFGKYIFGEDFCVSDKVELVPRGARKLTQPRRALRRAVNASTWCGWHRSGVNASKWEWGREGWDW